MVRSERRLIPPCGGINVMVRSRRLYRTFILRTPTSGDLSLSLALSQTENRVFVVKTVPNYQKENHHSSTYDSLFPVVIDNHIMCMKNCLELPGSRSVSYTHLT